MAAHRSPVVVALLLALGTLAFGASSAAAAAGDGPIILYAGEGTVTALDDGSTSPVAVAMTVDCSATPCTIAGTISADGISLTFTGAQPLALTDGRAETEIPTSGDVCDNTYRGGGPLSLTVTPESVSGTGTYAGSDEVDCPDGSAVQYLASRLDFTVAYVSGDTCFLTNTCVTATPTASPTAIAAPITEVSSSTALQAGEPGILSTLATVPQALTPRNVLWAAAGTVVLAILVALPSHLLTAAVEGASDRFSGWWRRRQPESTGKTRRWILPAGIALAALISSFADPAFGLSLGGLRVFLSIAVSFVVDAALGWLLVLWVLRKTRPGTPASVRFLPATLLVVAIAVLFTRITGFQPGIIFGLVAGIAVGAALATADKARIALAGLGWSFALAILGWIGYSLMSPVDATPLTLFIRELLSALAIGGIAALPIALIPLRGLVGKEIYEWNRWVWAASYAVGLFAFLIVLMPMPFSWEAVPLGLWAWVGIYLAYALSAVSLWLALSRPWRRATD